MLWGYDHYKYFNSFSVGTVFIRQNRRRQILTHKDGLILNYLKFSPITRICLFSDQTYMQIFMFKHSFNSQ